GIVPILVGIAVIPMTPRADVLILNTGKLFAVRDDNGILRISSGRAGKFARNIWIEREGGKGHAFWKEKNLSISCDVNACIYRNKNGRLVSFVKEFQALKQDCATADVVISALYIKRNLCEKPAFFLAKSGLKRQGAHAIYFGEDGVLTVKTVTGDRGERPWAPKYVRRKYVR
ncbi:MAG: hypothetical protein KAI61_08455, partial [Alphaproteobacteria bacterium]|nr:hypothetical protein [Alphaproteobacteria bacterium]